ncbi:DUF6468 domain-containing protein [Phreatobacter sp.]|uniref:DUF6468 domain-containing protein n=1 Tax=Phreatobacter sp. TaxID=1966341 RepID=UPI003F6E6CCF
MMSGFTVSLAIELLVAVLLAATIGYCVRLNRRLIRLKADDQALKATIAELITATEIAERAIQGLKVTVRECDGTLGERLRTAERFLGDIEREVKAGQTVVDRISRITEAARSRPAAPAVVAPPVAPVVPVTVAAKPASAASAMPDPGPNAASTLAAASAFAARVSSRAA